jgi:chromosome segregation ATPase
MPRIEEVTGESEILEKLNKTMDELITYRNIYTATIDTANERMKKIESKLEEKETPKEIQVQIEKIEETIERLSVSLNELLEGHEKVLSELGKERKEDLAYLKGLDNELKSHVITTDDKLKEIEKSVAKAQKETEGVNKFKKAFQNFLKAVME